MKQIIFTEKAPRPVGPYSQATSYGPAIYCSGQIGLDPSTGKLVEGGVEAQAERCLKNLQSVLTASNRSLRDVVKTTVFVTDMEDFKAINEVYARYFTDDPPARSTVGVAALPLGAKVEIEAIALR